ncbi:four helix bundle protein [Candidatus Nomurabacteria bacterium]|nr:four helix bundle protein [Candidatus Nomurabacteria bacterium]
MRIEKFEEIISWQKGKDLTINVYIVFKSCKDYSFKNQIERASVSIMNNIAEGFERRTNKELKNFLFISKGSAGEVRSMLNLGLELKYITERDFKKMYDLTLEISKLLSGLIKTLD